MGDFEEKLNSLLNDPKQMEQITAMAKSLMGGSETAAQPPKSTGSGVAGLLEGIDPTTLGRLSAVVGGVGRRDEKRALLEAMKPYLSPARRERLEKAMKLAKMIGMAEIAFETLGGDHAEI